jgi:hypothetical protein
MSTIRHPVQHHTWWYAAAAAIVMGGLLAVLMATVFSTSTSSGSTTPAQSVPGTSAKPYHGPMFHEVCFVHRPAQNIELPGAGCVAP